MVRRERAEKMAFGRLLANLLGPLARLSPEAVEPILEVYERRITHEVYSQPAPPAAQRKKTRQAEDQARLAKLDQLTVSDDDFPPPPKKPGGRKRR